MLIAPIYPVTCHTDHVGKGSTFVAIKGFKVDGTTFIQTALEKGASKIVVEESCHHNDLAALCAQHGATYHTVPNARQALAILSAQALDHPIRKLKIVGITGTKGKSTTTYLVEHVIRQAGYKTALLSTIANRIERDEVAAERTTPESDYIQMFLAACVKRGVQYVIMEVSSHALSLDRVFGLEFDAAAFTNLSPDHLDFHPTINDYFAAKMQLFTMLKQNACLVINSDNEWGIKALEKITATNHSAHEKVYTFGTEHQAQQNQNHQHIHMSVHQASCDGIELALNLRPIMFIECPQLFGMFNCYNITLAAIIAQHLGITYTAIIKAFASFKGVPGRLQRHKLKNNALAFVDYAHNAASTREILTTLRPFTPHLIAVFGCGGDRDPARRPGMGSAAADFADVIIITSDNPRSEDPAAIATDIVNGIAPNQRHKIIIQLDRAKAIEQAAKLSNEDSIIVLLGKGHETTFIQGDTITHFDDLEEIKKF
jgi:UDP-N-acetylmuramoyl-L-alanyl-D-glutamate--2,6-diaminopimelate ligase